MRYCPNKSKRKYFSIKNSIKSLFFTIIPYLMKKQHCCEGHPAQQKHSSLVLSAGKSSDMNFPA